MAAREDRQCHQEPLELYNQKKATNDEYRLVAGWRCDPETSVPDAPKGQESVMEADKHHRQRQPELVRLTQEKRQLEPTVEASDAFDSDRHPGTAGVRVLVGIEDLEGDRRELISIAN